MGRLSRFLVSCLILGGCARDEVPAGPGERTAVSTTRWAAHPDLPDPADAVPSAPSLPPATRALLGDHQATARAAAFYLHPTTDLSMAVQNATSPEADALTDEAIRYQASLLNGIARTWAPRYRQASLGALVVAAPPGNAQALDAAYADVAAAFDEFLKESGDLPILLLGHGQGAVHLVRLLRERFDGQPLARRLVVAWLAGTFVGPDTFRHLPLCTTPSATGCIASWATAAPNARPRFACGSAQLSTCAPPAHTRQLPVACFNPLTGGTGAAPAVANLGAGPGGGLFSGRFFDFTPGLVGATCDAQGILRIDDATEAEGLSARDFAGIEEGDHHTQDINLFYLNLRRDGATRLAAWFASPAAKTP